MGADDVADFGDFSISMDGVLNFNWPPNFEDPESSTSTSDDDNVTLAAKNVYKIVLVASDDAPGADGNAGSVSNPAYHKVTVTVTDVDEAGSISLSNQQPQVGIALIASLADPGHDRCPNHQRQVEVGAWHGCRWTLDCDRWRHDKVPNAGCGPRRQVPTCDRHLHRRVW